MKPSEVGRSPDGMRSWILRLAALVAVLALGAMGWSVFGPSMARKPVETPGPPQVTEQGYAYGVRGSHLTRATVIASLDILDEAGGGQVARITLRKGPEYADCDPDLNGYPGCTLLAALTGEFFEDKDSAQVVVCWKDRRGRLFGGDNLAGAPAPERLLAARWRWADSAQNQDAVCVDVPIGKEAVELTALVVYTDVLYVYEDIVPEDGPAVVGSWDAVRRGGHWQITMREEIGAGATPYLDAQARDQSVNDIRDMIRARTGGLYTLKGRYNIGLGSDPVDPARMVEYDSGFDIVRTREPPVSQVH